MRRFTIVGAFLLSVIIMGTGALQAQTSIDDWGALGSRLASSGWTLDNTATTPAGEVHLSGPGSTSSNWTAVRGAFADTVNLTVGQTLVVRGSLTINGDFEGWNPLRFGVFGHTDAGMLVDAGTDSAMWGYVQYAGTDSATFVSNESGAYGYMISNQVGAAGGIGGQGGNGNAWAVNGGSWISTWSGGTQSLGQTIQSPRRANMLAGTYDFEMSVEMTSDTTSEFRWYIMNTDGETYLHSGVHTDNFEYVGTDSSTVIDSFNGFVFSHEGNEGNDGVTEVTLTDVEYEIGSPITIPEPIFSAFYVSDWGAIGSRLAATGWTLNNDTTTFAGDAILSGPEGTNSNWTAVRGGFGELAVEATLEEALIIRGELEINEDFEGWNPLRFGVFNHTDIGTLHNQYTDSAIWGYTQYADTDSAAFVSNESSAHGYMISNQVGAAGGIGGQGGNGNAWAVNGGSWISTWSGGSVTLGQTIQSPRRANMLAGTYEFEMSVQPLADGTTEFRWYIISDDEETYLQSGVHIDTTAQKTTFNGFVFSHEGNEGNESVTAVDVLAVQVDKGAPIEIPEPIFSEFYISDWGAIGTRLDASGWTLDNDTTTFAGDAYLSGPEGTNSNWSAIRGGFGELPVSASLEEALIVRGELEINGDFGGWNPLRFGVFNHTDIGSLHNQYTDSAIWGYTQYADTDSAAFVSNESSAFGYLISNQVGAAGGIGGQGGNGNAWAVNGGSWISTWSGGSVTLGQTQQSPRRANMAAGTYEFEMSVQPLADGTTEFRWYIIDEDGENYLHSGIHIDTTAQKTDFNGFVFSHEGNEGNEGVTEVNLIAVQVDKGEPIEIPQAIFSPFYVSDWGFLGGKLGGTSATDSAWALTPNGPNNFAGDVIVEGPAATGWANVAANFGIEVTPSADEALIVTGNVIFEGGGFEDAGSFRFGLFNAANLGGLDSTETVGYVWSGEETGYSGFMFNPNSGGVTATNVSNGTWYTGSADLTTGLVTGTPGAGEYELTMAVYPTTGGMQYAVQLEGDDYLYQAAGIDAADPAVTTTFNSLAFGVSNSTTTSMFLEEIYVNLVDPSEIGVSAEEDDKLGLPTVYALEQNYPNPFNPSTNIQFSLPEAAKVSLEVYDMLGRKVATLIDGEQLNAAYHTVSFDASSLASGMYIYRINAGSFVSTKKMMLIK